MSSFFLSNFEHDLTPTFLAPAATVNRCGHVGGPEWAECGCPLDFDCRHGGTCETRDECEGRES